MSDAVERNTTMHAMIALLEEVLRTKQCVGQEALGRLSQGEQTFLVRLLATKHELLSDVLLSDGCQSARALTELQYFRDRSMDECVLVVILLTVSFVLAC